MKNHQYKATTIWTGNLGMGTQGYKSYKRHHTIRMTGKPDILGSSQPSYAGDADRHNPEELLLASLSACHMLWYLHLCANASITVVGYTDEAEGTMLETEEGGGHFTGVLLRPTITLTDESAIEKANDLHQEAQRLCFIANSVNFPVHCQPSFRTTASGLDPSSGKLG